MPSPKVPCGTCGKPSESGLCWGCRYPDADKKSATPSAETFVGAENKAEISRITDQRVRTLADMIRVCEIDTTEWEVKRWVANKWEMGYKDKAQEAHTKPLFQIKVWLERKVAVMDARAEIAVMLADLRKEVKPRPAPAIVKSVGERHYMLEPHVPDLHLGKLSWDEETGHGNYDSKIATELFSEALEALIARTASFSFERVLFPLGNDFFNVDSTNNMTTRGTPQDVDGRFQKSFRLGKQIAVAAIERLRTVAPQVDVAVVRGNHDTMSAWFLGEVLDTLYANTPGVHIDNSPKARKYVEYHRNMIMLTHGDHGKRENYSRIMAAEESEMWGRTKHREAHTGHLHQMRVQEFHGVKVRISPALCSADAWHADNQYVGNARGAEAFTWHREEGIVGIANYTVPTLASKSRKRAA